MLGQSPDIVSNLEYIYMCVCIDTHIHRHRHRNSAPPE